MRHLIRSINAVLLLAVGGLAGCGDSTSPARARLEGTYAATRFTSQMGDDEFDWLALGISMTLTLKPDGTTEGAVIVNGVGASLAGTWDTAQSVLRLQQVSVTFLREIPFHVSGHQLVGDTTVGATTFGITLTASH